MVKKIAFALYNLSCLQMKTSANWSTSSNLSLRPIAADGGSKMALCRITLLACLFVVGRMVWRGIVIVHMHVLVPHMNNTYRIKAIMWVFLQ